MEQTPDSLKARVTALAGEATAGDDRAFEELVGMYQERVFRLIYHRTRSRTDAEDLTQDVLLKAYRKIGSLREVEHFQSWLFRIAVNSVQDLYRKRKVKAALFLERGESRNVNEAPEPGALVPDEKQMGGEEHVSNMEFWNHIGNLSDRLGAREREVFLLRYLDGLELKEIAAIIGKTEGTVKTSLHRAVKKFRKDEKLRSFLGEVS